MEKQVVIITGDSSGLGESLKKQYRKNSHVYGISRRESINEPNHFQADVLDYERLRKIVEEVYQKHHRIDLLICCAGMGVSGATEQISVNDISDQIDINLKGVIYSNKAVIPYMRKQKSGRIVNISSVAAVAPIPFQSMYSATKAAVNAYSMALANELAQFGIKVISVMPGDINTGFTSARRKTDDKENLYNGLVSISTSIMECDEKCGTDAEAEAEMIYKLINRKNPKLIYTIGVKYQIIALLIKFAPYNLVNRVLGKTYLKQK